ncbi:hypothetical protein RJ640_000818, partial [Escallonia rubra]
MIATEETEENPEPESNEDVTKETPETEHAKIQEDSDDQSSPRGVLEIPVLGSDSDNSSNIGSSSRSSSSCGSSLSEKSGEQKGSFGESHGLHWKNLIENIKRRSLRRFSTIPLLGGYESSRKNAKRKLGRNRSSEESIDCGGLIVPKPSWRNFSYEELVAATDNYNP